jgi:hypothetical protein
VPDCFRSGLVENDETYRRGAPPWGVRTHGTPACPLLSPSPPPLHPSSPPSWSFPLHRTRPTSPPALSRSPYPVFSSFYFRESLLNTPLWRAEKETQREFPRSQSGAGYSVTVIWCLRAHRPCTSGEHLLSRPSPSRLLVRRHFGHSAAFWSIG